ncbi:MAG: TRAP transporter substrate-binding protein [Oscillospiraceae bacterium]|nr:TRAP transporter substrate-binding protein [Oscillospiraceae bacterium]
MKKIVAIAIALCMVFALCACGSSAPAASTATSAPAAAAPAESTAAETTEFPTMHLQLGHVNPTTDDDQYNKLAVLFTEKVTERTNGAVTFDIMGNSELGGEADVLTGFDLGTHDIAIITNSSYSNLYGPSMINDMPFIYKDNETAWAFVDGEIMKGITDGLYETLGYKVLGWGEGGFRNVLSQKPVRTPEDLKGVKLRVPGMEILLKTFEAIGASPSPLDFSETFTAVQQGVLDGLELPIASAYTGSYYEICKYYNLTGHSYNAISVSCSRSFWESLTPELQEIFATAAVEAGQEQRAWLQEAAQGMLDKMAEGGCTIIDDVDSAAFREACAPVYDFYRDRIGGDLMDAALEAVK